MGVDPFEERAVDRAPEALVGLTLVRGRSRLDGLTLVCGRSRLDGLALVRGAARVAGLVGIGDGADPRAGHVRDRDRHR